MATNKSAEKRQRQNEKKRLSNKHYRTLMKTQVKKLLDTIENKKKKEAQEALKKTISVINKVRSKGVIQDNTAARKISRLTRLTNGL